MDFVDYGWCDVFDWFFVDLFVGWVVGIGVVDGFVYIVRCCCWWGMGWCSVDD